MGQAFPLHLCVLQAIESWTAGRPGDEANFYPLSKGFANQWKSLNATNTEAENKNASIRVLNTFTSFDAPSRDVCGWSMHCACAALARRLSRTH